MTPLDALVLLIVSPFVALFLYTLGRVWWLKLLYWRWRRACRIAGRVLREAAEIHVLDIITDGATEEQFCARLRRGVDLSLRASELGRRYRDECHRIGVEP